MLRQRRPGRAGAEIVGGTVLEPAVEHEELVEAADRGHGARVTDRGAGHRSSCCRERLEGVAIERVHGAARADRELGERAQVARVALERVVGQPPLHAQMIEIRVDSSLQSPVSSRQSTVISQARD